MRMYGNKRITPVWGDYRPRERRWNNLKIHGWHNEERTGDTAVEWEDTYNDYVAGTFGGKSEQVVTVQGKNHYIKTGTITSPQKGVSITYDDATQTYTLNGTTTEIGNITLTLNMPCSINVGESFVTSRYLESGSISLPTGAYLLWSPFSMDGTKYSGRVNETNVNVNTILLSKSGTWFEQSGGIGYSLYIQCLGAVGIVFNNVKIKIQLELGSTATEYEPFVPNSPSPDYPSPIINAQPVVESRGRNLTSIPNHNISVTNDYYRNYFPQNPRVLLQPSTTYTMAFDYIINSTTNNISCGIGYGGNTYLRDIVYNILYPTQTQGRFRGTFTTPVSFDPIVGAPYLQIRFARLGAVGSFNVDISNIIIAFGSHMQLPYIPYRAPTTLEFPELRAIALPETATEWTYIRDGVKYWADTAVYVSGGDWDVVRRCDTLRLDANSNWIFIKTNGEGISTFYYLSNIPSPGSDTRIYKNMLCTHFRQESVVADNATRDGFAAYGNNPNRISQFFLRCSTIHTVDDLKYFLVNNNVFLLYELAAPTTERVQLGTLASFPRYTHLEQLADGVRANMELTAKVVDR